MTKLACAVGTLLLLAACSDTRNAYFPRPTVASSVSGVSDCTAGQDAKFLAEFRPTTINPYAANCSGNGY
jgi:hypothetical protein